MIVIQTRLTRSGRRMVTISQDQVDSLAGNCYEVIGEDGRNKIIISTRSVRDPRFAEHELCNALLPPEHGQASTLTRGPCWRGPGMWSGVMWTPSRRSVGAASGV